MLYLGAGVSQVWGLPQNRGYVRKLEKAVAVGNALLKKFSGKFSTLLENSSPIVRQHEMLHPCQGLGTFRQGKRLLENWPRLRERRWIFPSETATAFLSWEPVGHLQGSLGPSWPETPRKSEKSLLGPLAPDPRESGKKSRKSLSGSFRDFFQTLQTFSRLFLDSLGDKFGESLGGSQATPSFWEVPGLPRKFPKLPRKFFGDFPEVLSLWNFTAIQGFPRSFPDFPGGQPFLWEA